MILKDLKTGDKLKISKKGVTYIKGEHQGMNNAFVNLRSENKSNTRAWRESYRNKLLHEITTCYSTH